MTNETLEKMSLEDLMEACNGPDGQRFRWLKNKKDHWLAQARPIHPITRKDHKGVGPTPRQAMINLLEDIYPIQTNQTNVEE